MNLKKKKERERNLSLEILEEAVSNHLSSVLATSG